MDEHEFELVLPDGVRLPMPRRQLLAGNPQLTRKPRLDTLALEIELSEGAIASSSFYPQKPHRATRLSMPLLSARTAKWASNSLR